MFGVWAQTSEKGREREGGKKIVNTKQFVRFLRPIVGDGYRVHFSEI